MLNIKKASEAIENVTIRELIYGEPGIGKTTLALSAPSALLIDCDGGVRRVDAKYRKDYVPVTNWEDITAIFENPEQIKNYETIVVDTVGKALDFCSTFLIKRDYKLGSKTGGLTLQGYGALLSEFRVFLARISQLGKNVIFIAHDREFQDGEVTKLRPDITGRSLGSILREMDLVGYMQSRNGQRTIAFSPSDRHYGKNTCRLADVIMVNDFDKGGANQMSEIFGQYKVNLEKQSEIRGDYEALITVIENAISEVTDVETATDTMETLKTLEEIWDSKTIARIKLSEKLKELGITWDKEKKMYVKQ